MNTYKNALIIDAIGAILSAIGSLLILNFINALMVIPEGWLIFTIFYALGIALFDVLSIIKFGNALDHCLKLTLTLNSIFVLLAIIYLMSNWVILASFGILYLIFEIIIVTVISVWQLTVIFKK